MKRATIGALALAAAFAVFPSALSALEVKEGLVKLVVNEANARISLYRLTDIAKGKYEALLFDQDPRTTFATLSADGKLYKLGDSAEFRSSVVRDDAGVRIEFRSAFAVVREIFAFAKSEGSALADGLQVSFELENVSEKDESLGIRYLVDTYLGEKSGLHFITDKRPKISEETAILPSAEDTWIESAGEKASFMLIFSGAGVDRPDRIVLANWKRLSDAPWSFELNALRNFTLLPYSINDSAAALYYEPQSVSRGATRRLSFVMGAFNDHGYPAASSAPGAAAAASTKQTEAIFASTVLGSQSADPSTAMAADLVATRDLISRIDRAMAVGGEISADEIAAWTKILDRLEERKKGY